MSEADRLLAPTRKSEDIDAALRPKSLDDFVGRKAARENLRVFIAAAKSLRKAVKPRRIGSWAAPGYIRSMTQLTISMPSVLQNWVESRISEGAYADAADYLRDLVRRDQAASAGRQWVKEMVDEGLRSGVIDRDPRDIIADVIAEDPDLRD